MRAAQWGNVGGETIQPETTEAARQREHAVLRMLGRYELLEQVGSGGMAVVYRGRDTALDREVAVKLLHPHLASAHESRARFSREARAVARLAHPGIVEIYDYSGLRSRWMTPAEWACTSASARARPTSIASSGYPNPTSCAKPRSVGPRTNSVTR